MEKFNEFYKHILAELDFSIVGHKDMAAIINRFFYHISHSPLISEQPHLDFISYSYAQVADINTWKLTPMSSEYPFYYKSFNDEKNILYKLSLYYDFKDFLKSIYSSNGDVNRLIVSEIVSKVFNKPTPYRVRFTDSSASNVSYDQESDVITFEISLKSLLKAELEISLSELNDFLKDKLNDVKRNRSIDPRLERKEHSYKIIDKRVFNDIFLNNWFDKKKIENEIKTLSNQSRNLVCNQNFDILNYSEDGNDNLILEWIKVVLGHGFLSIFSNRWVENIPSVTKVDYNSSDPVIKKSIGTFILGYSFEQPISDSERAMFRTIADKVSSVVTAQVVADINNELIDQAKKSAISKVMSRNMSHNLGSHVLSRLSKKYSGEQNELEPDDLTLEGMAKFGQFFSYLMRRMDFLADIATTVPVMTTTSEFVKEIFNPFKDNTFIEKHITGNDLGFNIYPPVTGSNGLYVSIPNDILGKQAIYTIFENVIRNSAKHGSHKRDKFTIDVQCSTDVNYPDHIKFTIFDDSVNRDAEVLAVELNRKIDLPLLDDNNTLRKEAWGMLEMKIAAAYLRKIALSSIDHKKWNATVAHTDTPPLLKAAVVNDVHLGYEFYLLRPKEGVIIHPEKRMERINFGKGSEEISSFRDYHELSEFSIIGFNHEKLNPSEISMFEKHPGKFTRRFLKNIDNNESHREIETLWKSWLQTIAQNKVIKDIRIVFQSDVEAPVTIEEVSIGEIGKSIKASFVHHPKNTLPEADFVESTTGNSLFSRFKSDDNGSEQLKYYLIEGIIADIVLLDERIQEFALETTLDESIPITLQQYYEKLGIYIPARETCWLNDPYSNEYREKVEKWLREKLPAADFFVVHIGVLEKLLQLSNYPDSEKSVQIEKYVHDLSKFSPDIFNKIIFISGRGRPDTIPAKYRFLNYSNIDQLLEKRICKSTLTGLLYSARSYEEII